MSSYGILTSFIGLKMNSYSLKINNSGLNLDTVKVLFNKPQKYDLTVFADKTFREINNSRNWPKMKF